MVSDYHEFAKGAIRTAVPDTTQQTGYTCGAAALQAVCRYYGVGPDTEEGFEEAMQMPKSGADPDDLVRAAEQFGLEYEQFFPMSLSQLKDCLDRRRPVILMLQAWGEARGRPRKSYENIYRDGHWVVAIGYDEDGVLFEDPSLQATRGFLPYAELQERWHDYGPTYERMDYYGVAIWRANVERPAYESRARHID